MIALASKFLPFFFKVVHYMYHVLFIMLFFVSITDISNYYLAIFSKSFDTYLIVPYAVIICLWGMKIRIIFRIIMIENTRFT